MAKINTITDQQMADLQRRASEANPMFSPETVRKRLASEAQRGKARQS